MAFGYKSVTPNTKHKFFSLLFLQLESKIKQVTSVKASRSGIVLVSLLVISVTQ